LGAYNVTTMDGYDWHPKRFTSGHHVWYPTSSRSIYESSGNSYHLSRRIMDITMREEGGDYKTWIRPEPW